MVIHMTIKQLEQELEIPRATIRFYEKEKLIAPKRSDNSYREYSDEDVAVLKKIIILRKIGLSVADIKKVLDGDCTLQSLLDMNISELQNQMKELEGAINVSKLMKDRNEDISSLDENRYWTEMEELEKADIKVKGCERCIGFVPHIEPAMKDDWATEYGDKIVLPVDAIIGRVYSDDYVEHVNIDKVFDDDIIYDIGMKSINKFKEIIIHQGGNPDVINNYMLFKIGKNKVEIKCNDIAECSAGTAIP